MSEQGKKKSSKSPQVDPAATDNLIGFFAQLMQIDQRLHPEDYEFRSEKDHA